MADEPRRGRLIVISGPSGVGKGTLVRALAGAFPFHFSVSATTRPPRPGEVDGEDYHFLDEPEFRRRIEAGDLLEWAEYSGHLYGTPRAAVASRVEVGHDVVLDIDVQGAMQVKQAFPEAVLIFLEPPSAEELERRLRGRGDTADIESRLESARREMSLAGEFHHCVVNDEIDAAVARVVAILAPPSPAEGRNQ